MATSFAALLAHTPDLYPARWLFLACQFFRYFWRARQSITLRAAVFPGGDGSTRIRRQLRASSRQLWLRRAVLKRDGLFNAQGGVFSFALLPQSGVHAG